MAIEKTTATTLVFTSADGRARADVSTQVDLAYMLDGGSTAVVSFPLTGLDQIETLLSAVAADGDVQALVVAATPVPEPEPEPEPTP
ncbi:hypothetical protein GCM10022239_03310 [Leifsonia bigeumensis]|uniref:Uncharacterized protein n=1 Tax=Leifsonella bigeumensis TaxID=433643 RepID=A0ABP7F285_9MICO